ncbi:MAG: DUF6906 family protein [Bacillota bacterium]|uniref:DUF6906 family protein n=1 Tax=Cytobacillus firmus TaxID=1399 RepID=UPI0018CEA283|nr:hypothetical protein [Cytobacillus firmus]MED1907831.1 hypothetical protein [Cytobacillus firmus]
MKHGRRPTLKQKRAMLAAELNPNKWLVVKNFPQHLRVVHRETGEEKSINQI